MNNEETKILNQNQPKETKVKTSEKKLSTSEKVAYAVGGFAAGVASGVAGSAMASTPNKEVNEEVITTSETVIEEEPVKVEEQSVPVTETLQPVPNPEDVLLATDEGVRIAQVNDEVSFSEAFADARAQVGAGGVFEWRGHVYGTYYEEEWNNMSSEERTQYQSKIDYQAVTGETTENDSTTKVSSTDTSDITSVDELPSENSQIASNAEMVDEQSGNEVIKVLGVEAVVDSQGNPMTVAAIELEGEQALLVDVDNNGTMDILIADANHDGQISENEFHDVSDAQISTTDLQQHMAATQNPDMTFASNDGMPDYMNDADVSSMA